MCAPFTFVAPSSTTIHHASPRPLPPNASPPSPLPSSSTPYLLSVFTLLQAAEMAAPTPVRFAVNCLSPSNSCTPAGAAPAARRCCWRKCRCWGCHRRCLCRRQCSCCCNVCCRYSWQCLCCYCGRHSALRHDTRHPCRLPPPPGSAPAAAFSLQGIQPTPRGVPSLTVNCKGGYADALGQPVGQLRVSPGPLASPPLLSGGGGCGGRCRWRSPRCHGHPLLTCAPPVG